MPVEALKSLLIKEHSKKNTVHLANLIMQGKLKMKDVFDLIESQQPIYSQRAAWITSTIEDIQPGFLHDFYDELISLTKKKHHDAVLRATYRSLSKFKIEEKDQGIVFDNGITLLQKKDTAFAIKAWIIDLLMNISKDYPELQSEILFCIKDQTINATPGLKGKIKKTIQIINNNLALNK